MNENEQQILMAMATANPEQRAMLNRRLVQLRAARRTATVAQHDAALPYEPTVGQMRHTSQTDWIDRLATTERADDEMRREAITEAQEWLSTKSALVRSDAEELHAQASGYARMWAGQFGPQMGIAQEAFLGRIARLTQGATELDYEDLFDEDRANKRHWEHADGKTGEFEESDRLKKQVVRPSNMPADYVEPDTSPWRQGKVGDIVDPTVTTVPIGLPKDPDADFNEGEWAAAGTVDNSVGLPSRLTQRKTAGDKWRVVQDVGNPGKWVVQKFTDDWGVWGDMGDAVDSQQAAYTKMDQWQADEREFPMESEGSLRMAADGATSYCMLCGKKLEQQDYAWYALKASPTQRDVGPHYHVPARREGRPGEFGPDGVLVPGTPGGEGGQYDAPAGTIFDAGGNAIQINASSRTADLNYLSPEDLQEEQASVEARYVGQRFKDVITGVEGTAIAAEANVFGGNPQLTIEWDDGSVSTEGLAAVLSGWPGKAASKTAAGNYYVQVNRLEDGSRTYKGPYLSPADAQREIDAWNDAEGSIGQRWNAVLVEGDEDFRAWQKAVKPQNKFDEQKRYFPTASLHMASGPAVIGDAVSFEGSMWYVMNQTDTGQIAITPADGYGMPLDSQMGTGRWVMPDEVEVMIPRSQHPIFAHSSLKTAGNPYPVGSSMWFGWEDDASGRTGNPAPEGSGPFDSGAPGGGIPLRGPLTPEQQAWLDKRGSRTAGFGSRAYEEGYADGMKADWSTNPASGWNETYNGNDDYGTGFNAATDARTERGDFRNPSTKVVGDGFVAYDDPDEFLQDFLGSRTAAGDVETWVSTGDDATSGGVPTWVSDAQAEARENGGYPDGYDETTGTYTKTAADASWYTKAYQQGLADGDLGDGIDLNPYPMFSGEADQWIMGYRDAQGLQPGQKASTKTAGSEVRDDEESPDPSIQIGDVLTRNEGEFATVTYVSGNYAELLYPSGFAFRTRLMESGPGQNGTAWHKVSSTTASSDSDAQQAWWDSMDIDTKKRYVTDQNAKYPDASHPDALAIAMIEIDAAAAADAIMPGRGPGWYEVYAAQLANLGVIRENGYNRLASKTAADDDDGGGMKCSVCGDAIEKNPGEDGYHHDNGEKHDHEAKPDSSKESSRTAGRVEDLIRRMENAPDFGYDDEEVELNEILARDGKTWMWGPGDRVQIIPGLNGVAGVHKMAVRQIPISEVQPGDVLVQDPDTPAIPERDTVQSVDSIGGSMFIIDFANGTSTAPMPNGLVYVAAFENPPSNTSTEKVVVTDNTHGIGFGWVVDEDGDDIHQDSINEDLGSELKKDASRTAVTNQSVRCHSCGWYGQAMDGFVDESMCPICGSDVDSVHVGDLPFWAEELSEMAVPRVARTAEWSDTFNKDKGKIQDSTTEVVPITAPPADDTAMFEPSDELDGHWKPSKHRTPVTGQRIQRASALDHSLFE